MDAKESKIFICVLILIAILASNGYCIGPQDTLRTDTGEIIPIADPGICGVDYADSQFIASLKPAYFNLPPGQTEAPLDSCSVESALRSLLQSHYVYYVEQVFTGAQLHDTLRVVGADTVMVPDLSHIFLLRQQASCEVLTAVEDLYSHQATRFAEPNYFSSLQAEPNDPYWGHPTYPQWNLKDIGYGIGCPTAWDETPGVSTIRLGIIDTGVNYTHPDLGGPIYPNDKIVGGKDYGDRDNDPMDTEGHGTAVTGIAAALTNNSIGVAGISGGWNIGGWDKGVKIYALKYTGAYGGQNTKVQAISEGADPNGNYACHILNCSWLTGFSDELGWAIASAYKVRANVVGGMGNLGEHGGHYPANCIYTNWVIGVGGYGMDGKYCDHNEYCPGVWSGYGIGLDLMAPATAIRVPNLNNEISTDFGGTSAAAPHVSGAVALLRSINNDLTPEDYEGILNFSADDPPPLESDGNVWTLHKRYGHGRLKISTAVGRLTDPSWQLTRHSATGGYVDGFLSTTYRFLPPAEGEEGYLDGSYTVERYEVRVKVVYPEQYIEIPYVWGIGEGPTGERTIGWSAADPNYQMGWCQLVPGTQKINSCVMRTYVYKVYGANPPEIWSWYPCAPNDVELQYRLWGQPGLAPPKVSGEELPFAISLKGNYPNPFNVSTVLSYELSQPGIINICVYNIMGQKVATLCDGYQSAGEYALTWDASDFPSGVYFARLKAGDIARDVKMLLLK